MRYTFTRTLLSVLALTAVAAMADDVPPPEAYLIDEARELELAATAGPEAITEGATYYVLRRDGYQKAVDGDNGFHCFVDRSWSTPTNDHRIVFDSRVLAPHCINEIGAASTMREYFLMARLIMDGKSADEVRAAIDAAYASGELRLPEGLSMTYMMSKHQWLGPNIAAWKPHLMLWIPYLDASAVGEQPPGSPHPVVAGGAGTRKSVLIVPLAEFVE